MTRFLVVLSLSIAVTAPALACGMYIPKHSLVSAMGSIDDGPTALQVEQLQAEQRRKAALEVNWVDRVGEVPYGSLPGERRGRAHRQVRAPDVEADAAVVAIVPEASPSTRMQQAKAFLRQWLEPAQAEALGDSGDTGLDTGTD